MDAPLDPSTRPSRIPPAIHALVIVSLGLSFISGALIWYGQTLNSQSEDPVFNVRPWLLVHGWLNPLLSVLFGILLWQHIRVGWKMRANWVTGLFMEIIYLVQILTGAGLYYLPETWRGPTLQIHHIAGLLLPIALTSHWISSQLWVKRLKK